MAEQVRACAVCGKNTLTLHMLPKDEELRKKWLEFVFGTSPAKYNATLVLCSNHFHHNDFLNLGSYRSGFASRLFLKPGSVPTVRIKSEDEGDVSPFRKRLSGSCRSEACADSSMCCYFIIRLITESS